nr:uncharacterized protein LOC111506157 [Leptinotarsa decemlineata]
MSSGDIDEILKRLSTKFNKIFYDREFVCCVQEDLQVILRNKNKCCVVVFPLLGPNYLKAVRYHARIFDLAVFLLGCDKTCSIAICHREHLLKQTNELEEQTMPEREQESGSKLRRKRPERQLYVPPAQRRFHVKFSTQESRVEDEISSKIDKQSCKKKETSKLTKIKIETKCNEYGNSKNDSAKCCINFEKVLNDLQAVVKNSACFNMCWKYELFDNTSVSSFRHVSFRYCLNEFTVFSYCHKPKMYILKKDYFLWQPKLNIILSEGVGAKFKVIFDDFQMPPTECNDIDRKMVPLLGFVLKKDYQEIMKCFHVFCDYDVLWVRNGFSNRRCLLDFFDGVYYYESSYSDSDELIEDWIKDNCQIEENCGNEVEEENCTLQKNNYKNHANLKKSTNSIKNTINVNERVKSKNDHEEEKEIMRKTKENINRKTRPIIKYIDDSNNTLKIGRNDNINNWEDLFDEEGQLEEDLLKEIIHKVGSEVTIVKAKEDYSDYMCKQIEELEHMVELYDFPSSFETHDIIQAFNDIKSDAMYVKWVDDTHAILVLGSLSQAQKAVNLSNSLIKVRPMAAASRVSLATAYQSDLKPAMKRPPTNLQTARRLITSHLGQKSSISREKSARERDDLRAAREMKKLVKKNEQDAWEGSLRSSIS